MFQSRNCPLCCAENVFSSVNARAKTPAESSQISALRELWRGFRSDSTFFTYVRCQSCEFVYCPSYLSEKQLDDLYALMPDNTNDEGLGTLRRTQSGYRRQITASGFMGYRVLDVGADLGLLSEAIRLHSPSVVVDAIEPNTGVHKELQAVIGTQGFVASSWDGLPNGKKYDLIAGIHVLDHLIDLKSALQEVVSRIRPGGHIYFVTHNERSLMRRLLGRRWPPFCLQHPHLFDHITLKKVIEDAGFREVRVRRTTNYFSLRHIAKVAIQLLGLPPKLGNLVPAAVLPLRLGNISVQGRWPD